MTLNVLSLVTNDRSRFYKQQVRGLENEGISVTTLSLPTNPEISDDVSETRGVKDYLQFYRTALHEADSDYDLVHANYGLTAPPAVMQRTLPVVLSLWGTDLFGPYGQVSRLCARFADEVIVMSPEMQHALGRDCHVIPHGVDIDRFKPMDQANARAELGWQGDAYHVLFPYPKQRAVKDYPRAARLISTVQARIDVPIELQTVNNVPHSEMPVYMNAADMLLMTSKREGSPNAVKEALSCNLPVVSTDVGDVRSNLDSVTHSSVGTDDIELAEAIEAVLRTVRDPPTQTKSERSNGRTVAKQLSHGALTKELLSVYYSVVSTDRTAQTVEISR